tara:strand:- start:14459 stop:14563 length:105 start_codon:yes stop_codon:yes gene_type:complete
MKQKLKDIIDLFGAIGVGLLLISFQIWYIITGRE